MKIEEIYKELTALVDSSKIKLNESMAKHTSFKIGGKADIFVKANSQEDIRNVLSIASKQNIPIYVIGNGSNILVSDNGIRGIVLMICIDTIEIEEKDDKAIITVGAGVKLAKLAGDLLKQEISGFEFASRSSWNYWRSNKNECGCAWKRNERYCFRNYIHGL